MTANILTVGHLRCLRWLNKRYDGVIVGLLTSNALKGYKDEIVLFDERYEIMKVITSYLGIILVLQDSLDPSENIKLLKPDCLASGDGFEFCELNAIKKYNLEKVDIPLPKDHSSSNIINKIKNETNSRS
jgi:bifunctional ADP-heptose synthase (sugar kinase/adenylyltransferase)